MLAVLCVRPINSLEINLLNTPGVSHATRLVNSLEVNGKGASEATGRSADSYV